MTRVRRCGYCYETGHNKIGCPVVKEKALAGEEYEKKILERSSLRQCSYCRETNHNRARCETKYQSDLRQAQTCWAGMEGIIRVISKKKLGKGAFIFGPLAYRGYSSFYKDEDGTHTYEFTNFVIEDYKNTTICNSDREALQVTITSLAEPLNNKFREFSRVSFIPGLYEEISSSEVSIGRDLWLRQNSYNRPETLEMRKLFADDFQVLVPSSEEEVENAILAFKLLKPIILNYSDSTSYRKALRASKKEIKNGNN